jgi:pimeloyl-ACP methyl ester carboxylesterase
MERASERGSATINGAEIAYEIAGDGPALTLIHAGITDMRMWDAQFAVFAREFRVLRYDLRGYGQSTLPDAPFTMRADLRALLDHCGIDRTHLIGVSMGGSIAIDCAIDYPERIASLIPVAAGINGQQGEPVLTDHWRELERQADEARERGDLDALNELELRLWIDGEGRTAGPIDPAIRERVRELNAWALRRESEPTTAAPTNRLAPPAIERLGEIAAPTLVIVGACDEAQTVLNADILATQIPDARKVVLPEVAHLPPMEVPEEFNRLVLEFLRGR